MKILFEHNEKCGCGVQIRVIDHDADPGNMVQTLFDKKPYTSLQAAILARKMLEIYNRDHGTEYTLEQVVEADPGTQNEPAGVTPKKDSGQNFFRQSENLLL